MKESINTRTPHSFNRLNFSLSDNVSDSHPNWITIHTIGSNKFSKLIVFFVLFVGSNSLLRMLDGDDDVEQFMKWWKVGNGEFTRSWKVFNYEFSSALWELVVCFDFWLFSRALLWSWKVSLSRIPSSLLFFKWSGLWALKPFWSIRPALSSCRERERIWATTHPGGQQRVWSVDHEAQPVQ